MKKALFGLVTLLAATAVASSAFAAAEAITGTTSLGVQKFQLSNNVTMAVLSTSTAYAAKSGHLNGDRAFGTNSTDSKLYYVSKAAGTAVVAGDVTSATQDMSGGTAL